MLDIIGRKLMVGDVFELPHLTDFNPLNETIPIGLRRYYQVTDANFASEGFSQTWYPHLWRIKCEPLVDSQEFADIMYEPINKDNYMGDWDPTATYEPGYTVKYGDKVYTPTQSVPAGTAPPDPLYWELSTELNLTDIIGRYNKNIEINQAVIDEAKRLVPKSGYDRSQLYVVPTFTNNEPAPPIAVIVPEGAATSTLTISSIASPLYKNTSKVVRIPKGKEIIKSLKLQGGLSISLQDAMSAPERTDSGSGPMVGDKILLASSLGLVINTPYGTADNTYSTADQFVNFIATALATPARSTIVSLLAIPEFLVAGLVLRATVFSENGTPTRIFPAGTRILSVNTVANTIVVSQPIAGAIPAGTAIEMSYDFEGVVTPVMDYLADCDPRFQYIRRSSPRSFGYLAGYLSGDDQAPNGYPMGAGTSFPADPQLGDYFMRLDYLPQKLFRFNGKMWVEISSNVRTDIGFTEDDQSQLSTFINNTAVVPTAQGGVIPSRQSLSNVLKIQPD